MVKGMVGMIRSMVGSVIEVWLRVWLRSDWVWLDVIDNKVYLVDCCGCMTVLVWELVVL